MQTQSHASLANVMDLLLDAVCVVDLQGHFVFVSAAFERIFGYAPAEVAGRRMIELVHPDDRARTLDAVDQIVAGTHMPHFENRYLRKDGRVVHIMWSARWSKVDQVRVAVARDVTERKRAEAMQAALYDISEAAHAAEDLLALFQRIHQIIGLLLPAKNFFVALYDDELDHLSFPYHVDSFDPAPAPGPLASGTMSAEVIRAGRVVLMTRDDVDRAGAEVAPDVGRVALDWLGVPLGAPNSAHDSGHDSARKGIIGALVVKSHSGDARYNAADAELLKFVSTQVAAAIERKQAQTRLQHSARHDPLTDLPNRTLVRDRMNTALARARRDTSRLALLYLDVDRFKQVNDRHGHAIGDALLKEVARRLKHCVRESDSVGRMGGDEFVVILGGDPSPEHAAQVAEKIRMLLCEPVELPGLTLSITPSIGMVGYPEQGDDAEHLIVLADAMMYAAKQAGGNCVRGVRSDAA